MDILGFIHHIPVIGAILQFVGTVACHSAQAVGSVSKDTLHTVGDKVYDVLQGFKTFMDALFGCGGGIPPAQPPAVPPV